jgi:hypothetical protein
VPAIDFAYPLLTSIMSGLIFPDVKESPDSVKLSYILTGHS